MKNQQQVLLYAMVIASCFVPALLVPVHMRPLGLSSGLRAPKENKKETDAPMRIDPAIVNMPKACLKESMDGTVIERNKCPEGQGCTKGPKEISKHGVDMKVWYCKKVKEEEKKPVTKSSEKMQGDQGKTDGAITTTQSFERTGLLAEWYFEACSILGPEGHVIRKRNCEKGMECSGKTSYYWLFNQDVEVHFCTKTAPKFPPELKGLPHWMVCYLLKRGFYGGKTIGEMPLGTQDGFVPVANC